MKIKDIFDKNINIFKIIISIILILIILGIIIAFNKIHDNDNLGEDFEYNVKKDIEILVKEKTYNDFKIVDINFEIDEYASYFSCKAQNITEDLVKGRDIFIVFIKDDKSELARFKYHLEDILIGEKTEISIITTTNLECAYDFYIE